MEKLDATADHAENFQLFCSAVNELIMDDASSTAILQGVFKDSKVQETDLDYIHAKFQFSVAVCNTEKATNLLSATKEINDIQRKLGKSTARKLMQ